MRWYSELSGFERRFLREVKKSFAEGEDYVKLKGVTDVRLIKTPFFPNVRNWVGTSIFGSLKPDSKYR
eukprot:UN00026